MKSDVENTINARVAATFADIPMVGREVDILKSAKDLVKDCMDRQDLLCPSKG